LCFHRHLRAFLSKFQASLVLEAVQLVEEAAEVALEVVPVVVKLAEEVVEAVPVVVPVVVVVVVVAHLVAPVVVVEVVPLEQRFLEVFDSLAFGSCLVCRF